MRWFGWAGRRGTDSALKAHRRWPRRLAVTLTVILVLYSLAGFLAAPYALRHYLTRSLAAQLHRNVTVGHIAFNPYKLRLVVEDVHVAGREIKRPFLDLKYLMVRVSWSSIRQLAPVIAELDGDGLTAHIERTGEQSFNFSDLLSANPPQPQAASKPFYFSISNIQLDHSEIDFNDQVMAQQHRVSHIRLALPFIANLPADTEIFVQPFLQMVIDGSPFSLDGKSKPFGLTRQTELDLDLHNLDLPRYFAYVPMKVPIKLPKGTFSTVVRVFFEDQNGHRDIRIGGGAALDTLEVDDLADAPLINLSHARVDFDQVEPLENVVHIKRILLDTLDTNLVRNSDGTTNLSALLHSSKSASPLPSTTSSPSGQATPEAAPTPATAPSVAVMQSATASRTPSSIEATPTPSPAAAQPPLAAGIQYAAPSAPTPTPVATAKPSMDFRLGSFELINSAVTLTDKSLPEPATISVNKIQAKLDDLQTLRDSNAPFQFNAALSSGGSITANGSYAFMRHRATTTTSLSQIDLAALKPFMQPYLNGTLASGKLDATATTQADFSSDKTNVHVEPASLALQNFDLRAADGKEQPLGFAKFTVDVKEVDLASQRAVINQVRADQLKLLVRRGSDQRLNLIELSRIGPVVAPPERAVTQAAKTVAHHTRRADVPLPPSVPSSPSQQKWQYQIGSVVLQNAEIHAIDNSGAKPVKIDAAPVQLTLKGVSSDLAKPVGVQLQATINRKGSMKIGGNAAPEPLNAKLQIDTKQLDLTPVNAYLSDHLNIRLASLFLTMRGTSEAVQQKGGLRATYRGGLVLGSARFLNNVSGNEFLRWSSLSANGIAAEYGRGKPRVRIHGIALTRFASRIILQSNGRLNFKDLTSSPTQVQNPATAAPPNSTAPKTSTPASSTSQSLPVDLAIGGITLEGGNINYTDNFIRPHYSADLNDVGGKIGAFGTASSAPATVMLQGLVNQNAPLQINGSINPLVPLSFVDLTAKADGIELPGLSPYSTKYTGYPILKGTLKVDVHYFLQDQKLTATNHIAIDQLTFGDKVEGKSVLNLPIRLAVALLKNPQGVIDLNIPVSGSLNDPQFSIAGAIWAVVQNLITKAVTAPFSLLANSVGGIAGVVGGGGGPELKSIEFKPGYADITQDSHKRLDLIAKALDARPGLQLEIAGAIDPRFDTDGVRSAKVDRQVLAQKLKDEGAAASSSTTAISADEYNKYLKRAYKAADFEKPRDFLGMVKSLPPDEMKKLMRTHETVTKDDLAKLADKRANAVRKALHQKGIDLSRLFVVAAQLDAHDPQNSDKSVVGVDLKLQ